MTYLEFQQAVGKQLTDVTADDSFAYSVLADYVKSRLAREVDHDIQLFRSYGADFQRNRLRLIGYDFTDSISDIQTAVRERLTVDADREGVQTFIDHQISAAITDIETLSTFIDQKLRQALLDLQSYIVPFRVGHSTSYFVDDVVTEMNASRLLLPDQAEVRDIYFVRIYPDLEEGTAYTVDDLVVSNGRLYKVTMGGTLAVDELGAGLQSEDGSETETLGELAFSFFSARTCCRWKMAPYPYRDRSDLAYGSRCVSCPVCDQSPETCSCVSECTDNCGNVVDTSDFVVQTDAPPFYFSTDPRGRTTYIYPKLDADHKVLVFWDGVRIDFADGDTVPMGERAVEAVAEYVGSNLYNVDDPQRARRMMEKYTALRAQLFLDNQNRTKAKYLN